MNNYITISAIAELTTPNNKKFKHTIWFEFFALPSEYTENILNSKNPLVEYKKSFKKNIESYVKYAVDDTEINFAKEHIENLNKFVRKWKNLGFDIVVSSISINDYEDDV